MERENRADQEGGRDERITVVEEQISFQFVTRDSDAGVSEAGGVGGEEGRPDPSLPENDDWGIRPYSPSERFVEPDNEIELAETMAVLPTNYLGVAGFTIALAALVPGVVGFIFAIGAILVSAAGIFVARNSAKSRAWAVGGFVIGLVLAAAHLRIPY